jgi:hypothetical protein
MFGWFRESETKLEKFDKILVEFEFQKSTQTYFPKIIKKYELPKYALSIYF